MERYTSFSIGRVQFIDSFQFTMQSLEKLVKTLDDDDCRHTRKAFKNEEEFHLMRRKGVFPYDFFDSVEILTSPELPSREAFYNTLQGEECTVEDYIHAKTVWRSFNCTSFRQYHDLYLKSDVLLLADFFEQFRRMCMSSYGLDAAHYHTAPGKF